MSQIRFVFFDLGNVLLRFSLEKMGKQGAEVTGHTPEDVLRAVFSNNNQRRVETGLCTELEFYHEFCNQLGSTPDPDLLAPALNDIFEPIEKTHDFVHFLASEHFPRGILSNTGPGHWNHCCRTFPFLFNLIPSNYILSYEVGAMKPDHAIYEAAFKTAQKSIPSILTDEILFIDDLRENVVAARQFGFDAVWYDPSIPFVSEIQTRGFKWPQN
ncbi:MAG: HAD family hydrolase [Thermoguttaceae bacterium]